MRRLVLTMVLVMGVSAQGWAEGSLASQLRDAAQGAAPSARASSQQLSQEPAQAKVPPSQAAIIAQQANPGSKVLKVKLLPSGEYAVTLKIGGSVQRVFVNATTGAIS